MKFSNGQIKIDQLVDYINAGKINLIPKFQRGSVWTPILRKKLLVNMVLARPIPAIFLYKEESGSKFEYNILDGKQRLESLILFIGEKHADLSIKELSAFFADTKVRKHRNFKIDINGKKRGFAQLDDEIVREFREYPIATIEISLEDSSIDEIVQLFVDINTHGVKVSRFDVVKAIAKDPLLDSVLGLVALAQERRESLFYQAKTRSPFVRVLSKQTIISRAPTNNARVERMWERLTELALFVRTGKHRAPIAILRAFIKGGQKEKEAALTKNEVRQLTTAFSFLATAYASSPALAASKLAMDQPRFYTMVCALMASDLLSSFSPAELTSRLTVFGQIIDKKSPVPAGLEKTFTDYADLAEKQTTNSGRRDERQKLFIAAVKALPK
jgi:hypothetical protein